MWFLTKLKDRLWNIHNRVHNQQFDIDHIERTLNYRAADIKLLETKMDALMDHLQLEYKELPASAVVQPKESKE